MKLTLFLLWLSYSSFGFCQQDLTTDSTTNSRTIRYPINPKATLYKLQNEYFVELFQLALKKSQADFTSKIISIPTMPQARSVTLIEQGFYDIHWMVSNAEREAKLAPIRIPLYKGLIGLRLAFVNKNKPDFLAQATTSEHLRKLVVGQGRDWPDSQILQENRFNLLTTTNTDTLFELLSKGRIDYLPRSVVEIWNEQEVLGNANVTIDQHIALYYPTAVYFFVRKDDKELYSAIEKGLQTALDDGSFDRLFYACFGDLITRAKLNKRHIFELDNPFLPKETPLADTRLWFNIKQNFQ